MKIKNYHWCWVLRRTLDSLLTQHQRLLYGRYSHFLTEALVARALRPRISSRQASGGGYHISTAPIARHHHRRLHRVNIIAAVCKIKKLKIHYLVKKILTYPSFGFQGQTRWPDRVCLRAFRRWPRRQRPSLCCCLSRPPPCGRWGRRWPQAALAAGRAAAAEEAAAPPLFAAAAAVGAWAPNRSLWAVLRWVALAAMRSELAELSAPAAAASPATTPAFCSSPTNGKSFHSNSPEMITKCIR